MSVIYLGLFLDEESQVRLLDAVDALLRIERYPNTHSHHLTLAYQPEDSQVQDYTPHIGREITLAVNRIVLNDGVIAAKVDRAQFPDWVTYCQPYPHITIACAEGVKPMMSNAVLKSRVYDSLVLYNPVLLQATMGVYTYRDGVVTEGVLL